MILMNFFDHRVKEYPFENILFLLIETLIGFIIMKSLYFIYSGIIYLIFSDALFRFKENKYVKWLTIPLSLLLIISNYNFFSTLFPLVNADAYLNVVITGRNQFTRYCEFIVFYFILDDLYCE